MRKKISIQLKLMLVTAGAGALAVLIVAVAYFLRLGVDTPVGSLGFAVLVLTIVSVAAAATLGRAMSKTIHALDKAVRQARVGGQSNPRLENHSNDEIGTLIEGFNSMLDQIEAEEGQLHQAIKSLEDQLGECKNQLHHEVEQRRQANEELIRSQHSIHDFFDKATVNIHWLSAEGVVLKATKAELAMLGYEQDDFVGHPIENFHNESGRIHEMLERLQAGEELQGYEIGMRCRNGQIRYVEIDASALWEHGKFLHARCFVRDLTGQKEAERSQIATERAERANSAKSEFLSRMSHELRTPLNSILGFSQVLQMEDLKPEHMESVQRIVAAGTNLLTLINEVLDISRIDRGHMILTKESVDLARAISDVVSLARPIANHKSIALVVDEESIGTKHVYADSQRLNQVLLNLLSNAVTYNRPQGHVKVQVVEVNSTVRIRVCDNGPGIPRNKRASLFLPFERLGADHAGIAGTGLGLALSKKLVEAMGGKIGIEDTTHGSVFFVELPEAPNETRSTPLTIAPAPRALRGGFLKTVLLIEDNLSNVNLIEKILANRPGIRLITAMQAATGLELARQDLPELVLLDLNLPDMHGEQVLARLQADVLTRDIPVAIVSADATHTQIERLKSMGVLAYITKPINVKTFIALMDSTLGSGEEQRRVA